MNTRRLKTVLLAAVLLITGEEKAVASSDWQTSLKVEIHARVKNSVSFPVSTTLENIGSADLTLHIWSCSYPDNWIADNSVVVMILLDCEKEALMNVRLKPGEKYQRDLDIGVGLPAKKAAAHEYVSFRLGFTDGNDHSVNHCVNELPRSVWSNSITIKVTDY